MNKLIKTLVYDRQISLSVIDSAKLVNDAIRIHKLDINDGALLGGLLTACAYMSGCLKSERGAVSITVRSADGGATVSVSGDIDGHIRGYIDGGNGSLTGGIMTVVKDDGFSRPFNGACLMQSDDISENLTEYFRISEQVETLVEIGVKTEKNKCVAAGGVIMQLLPGTSVENKKRAEEVMKNFKNVANLIEKEGADGILEKYFGEETEKGGVYTYFPAYKCNCSRKKIEGVILSLGKEEALGIIADEGLIKVHCHYCNKDYCFNRGDADKLFG